MRMLIYLTLSVISGQIIAQSWKAIEVQSMPMSISNNAVVEAFPGGIPYVYSFGGIDSTKVFSGITNQSFKYNIQTNVWDTIPSLPDPSTKIAAAASYVNGLIYIIGGYSVFSNGSEVSSNKIHRYDPVADTFLTDGVSIPVPIDDHVQAVYKDSLIYVVTGWSNTTNVNNVQIYDTYLNTWSVGTPVRFNIHQVFGSTGTIVGDTIYYFGGAERTTNFPANNYLKKGAIDPTNPNQIVWLWSIPNPAIYAYRPACTSVGGEIHWLGGSSISYNYNGIAYNGSGGVPPANRSITYVPNSNGFFTLPPDSGNLPMDLRGVASINDTIKYLAGGMMSNQQVTNKTWRLEYVRLATGLTEVKAEVEFSIFPNPVRRRLMLKFANSGSYKMELFDAAGRLVLDRVANGGEAEMGLSSVSQGVFLLRVSDGNKVTTKKVIVSHP